MASTRNDPESNLQGTFSWREPGDSLPLPTDPKPPRQLTNSQQAFRADRLAENNRYRSVQPDPSTIRHLTPEQRAEQAAGWAAVKAELLARQAGEQAVETQVQLQLPIEDTK